MNPFKFIPGADLGEKLATRKIPDASKALVDRHIKAKIANLNRDFTAEEFVLAVAGNVGKAALSHATSGGTDALVDFVMEYANTAQAHMETIKLLDNKIPGMEHETVIINDPVSGKPSTFNIWVDATDPSQTPSVYYLEDGEVKKFGANSEGRMKPSMAKALSGHKDRLTAKAQNDVGEYIVEHGQENYDQMLANAAEGSFVSEEYAATLAPKDPATEGNKILIADNSSIVNKAIIDYAF